MKEITKQFKSSKIYIDELCSNDTDWEYIDNILEIFEVDGMLTKKGINFRNYMKKGWIKQKWVLK